LRLQLCQVALRRLDLNRRRFGFTPLQRIPAKLAPKLKCTRQLALLTKPWNCVILPDETMFR